MAAIHGESTSAMNRLIVLGSDFSALKFIRCNDWIHGVEARVWLSIVNERNASGTLQLTHDDYGRASASTSAICFGRIFVRSLI